MIDNYKRKPANIFWSYKWSFDKTPVAFFNSQKASTNAIYTHDELTSILLRSDQENDFIPVPRSVMQNALDAMDSNLAVAA